MRITVDRDRCVGAGQCVLAEPGLFDQSDEDGRVVLLVDATQPEGIDLASRVVPLCPSRALGVAES